LELQHAHGIPTQQGVTFQALMKTLGQQFLFKGTTWLLVDKKLTIASSKPPPRASPSTAATTGFFESAFINNAN